MNKIKLFLCVITMLSPIVCPSAMATSLAGDVFITTDNSDSEGYTGADNITVQSGSTGALLITAADGGYIQVNDTFAIQGDFLHNGSPTLGVSDPTFSGTGSFSFTGDNASVTAKKLTVGQDFLNGDGTDSWNLTLNVDAIDVTGSFIAEENSHLVINATYATNPSLTAGNTVIKGNLYMGNSATSGNVITIKSVGNTDQYKMVSVDDFQLTGNIAVDQGTLTIESGLDTQISGNVSGNVNFSNSNMSLGGANIVAHSDWKQQLNHISDGAGGYLGNLTSDGIINSTGDILIGGAVNGHLDITSNNMWVGDDLLGNWQINVDHLYVLGDVIGDGHIAADTINIAGNLSGHINILADTVLIEKDVLGGTVFRPNLPTGQQDHINVGTFPNRFHVNPETGLSADFKQINATINGTYYFNNDSYLQLVLNSTTANSDGNAEYDALTDDALIKVGGFDASNVSNAPHFGNMNTTPGIEILVDNIDTMIQKIRVMEITDPSGIVDLGNMNLAGVWFYWDDNNDGVNDRRLFQESKLVAENGNIYAQLVMMQSLEKITRRSASANRNDIQMAGAIDDLILGRLRGYAGYTDDNMENYYTSVLRLLFGESDVYYDLMLNGGNVRDVVDIMVAENPQYALALVRGFDLTEVSDAGNKLALSNQVSRNAVSDQLIEDFIWKRYYDKSTGWARFGFGSDIFSMHVGADTKIDKFIAGFNIGYNSLGYDLTDGSTFNIGVYGTYDLTDAARLYASLNLGFNSIDIELDRQMMGTVDSKFNTIDATMDVGILHKIFDQYITGRGYMTLGVQGGYDFSQEYKGQDFMNIRADEKYILAPGYEVSLGKDIWFSVGSFMRPSIKIGVQYDLMGSANRDLDFKFAEVHNWRSWNANDDGGLWWRFAGQIDFSIILGTNLSVRYELLKNGDFSTNQFKINGTYRF